MLPKLFLQRHYLGAPVQSWMIGLGISCVVALSLIVARGVLLGRVRRLGNGSPSALDDFFVSLTSSLRSLFFVALGLWVASEYVQFAAWLQHDLRVGVTLLTLLQVGLSMQAAIGAVARNWSGSGVPGEAKMAASATAFLASLAIWAILIVSGLSVLGFQISALLAGLGVGGVAAALAVQNILGDVFASLSIYFDRPFHIGDFIVVGEEMGSVERIGLRTTRVRSLSGEEIVFGNGDLTKSRLRNFRRMEQRRVEFGFGVDYDTTPEQLETIPDLIRQAVERRSGTRFDRAHFKAYGDSALRFEVVYFVLSPDYNLYMDHQQAINLELFRVFAERQIRFALTTQKLLLSRSSEAKESTGASG